MTAAALGDALGVPVYGVCTHDAIAAHAQSPRRLGAATGRIGARPSGFAVVVTDARRRECYWADYDASGTRISGPHVERPADVVARPDWRRHGSGDRRSRPSPNRSEPRVVPSRAGPDGPGARGQRTDRRCSLRDRLEPLYLRRPDARTAIGRASR
ncbi:MAG: hypothetical protein WKF47_01260 [Geodermatophilaceae bacterium]